MQDLLQYNLLLLLSLFYTLISKLNLILYKNFSSFFDTSSNVGYKSNIPSTTKQPKNSPEILSQNFVQQDLMKLAASLYKVSKTLSMIELQADLNPYKSSKFILNLTNTTQLGSYVKIILYLSTSRKCNFNSHSLNELIFDLEKNYLLSSHTSKLSTVYSHEIDLRSLTSISLIPQKIFTNNLTENHLLASQSR
jgi:hypothetical protein